MFLYNVWDLALICLILFIILNSISMNLYLRYIYFCCKISDRSFNISKDEIDIIAKNQRPEFFSLYSFRNEKRRNLIDKFHSKDGFWYYLFNSKTKKQLKNDEWKPKTIEELDNLYIEYRNGNL